MKQPLNFRALAAVGVLIAGMIAQQAHATQIVGSVAFENGNAVLNGPLATATAITGYQGTTIVNPNTQNTNLDYAGTGNSVVTFSPFTFNPVTVPVNPMWTYTSGLDTYFFDLSSLSVALQNSNFLDLTGKGTLFIQTTIGGNNVFTPTLGNFTFDIQTVSGNAQDTFEFTASNIAAAPDHGMTVVLLGLSMAGLWAFRRRIAVLARA